MKVLFVHDGPIYKDAEGNIYGIHLNDDLRKRYLHLGEKVTFLMRIYDLKDNDPKKYSKISKENFSYIEVPNFKSFRLFFKKRAEVNRIVENAVLDHDVIMARLPSATGSLSVKYATIHKKPLITEVVACNWDSFWNYGFKGKLVAPYFYFKQKRIMSGIKYSMYVTKEFLQRRYPTKGKSINCSNVELHEINEDILSKRLQKINDTDFSKSLTLGTIAAIDVPYKGQSDVIKAIRKLKDIGIEVHYKIVGQGNPENLSKIIRSLKLEENVKILGALKHEEVFVFLDSIDLYVQPSKQEGLPRAMIEAMSRACPSFGANTAGIPELIDKDFIFGKGDINGIISVFKLFNKEVMINEAIRNFSAAKDYEKNILYKRRFEFYSQFLLDHNLPRPALLIEDLKD